MAEDNSILGLRAQITGKNIVLDLVTPAYARTTNMKALDMDPAAEIITVVDKGKWDAFIVKGSKLVYRHTDAFDTPEAALRFLLEMLSFHLYSKFEDEFEGTFEDK